MVIAVFLFVAFAISLLFNIKPEKLIIVYNYFF